MTHEDIATSKEHAKQVAAVHEAVRHANGISLRRLGQALLTDPTTNLEVAIGFIFIALRGLFLFAYQLPPGAEPWLETVGLSVDKLAWSCIFVALLHFIMATTERFGLRAMACFCGLALGISTAFAFFAGPTEWRAFASWWAATTIIEFYLLLRNILAKDITKEHLDQQVMAIHAGG